MVRKLAVVGAGPVGTAISLSLASQGHEVTLVADRLPGDGITSDLAAGMGCIFRPSNQDVLNWVFDSYGSWMQDASSSECPHVMNTRLTAVIGAAEADPEWRDRVRDFRRDSSVRLSYQTYSFDPVGLGRWRLERFRSEGGRVEKRSLSPVEVAALRQGESLAGYEHTIVAVGLNLRGMWPQLSLFPVRGLLVHFSPAADSDVSYSDEDLVSYVVSRPGGMVVGGTYDEYIETCTDEEQQVIGARLVAQANEQFGLNLQFEQRNKITVGYRPAVLGNPIVDLRQEISIVGGLGGQGWVTSPAIATSVADHVASLVD